MLKKLKNRKAQVIASEYVLAIFIVFGMIGAMTMFIKRAVQARIYDARNAMVETVADRTTGYYDNAVYAEYEPYYMNREAITYGSYYTREAIQGVPGMAGIFTKNINSYTRVETFSETLPPKAAD